MEIECQDGNWEGRPRSLEGGIEVFIPNSFLRPVEWRSVTVLNTQTPQTVVARALGWAQRPIPSTVLTQSGLHHQRSIQAIFPTECPSASISEGVLDGRVLGSTGSTGSNSADLLSLLHTLAVRKVAFDPRGSLKMALTPTAAQMTVNHRGSSHEDIRNRKEVRAAPRAEIRIWPEQESVVASDMQLSELLAANCTTGVTLNEGA